MGLVINVEERSCLNIQSMIGLLRELKINLKHVVVIFTHGDTLLQNPTTMELEERCTKRCELLPQHIKKLECLVRLLADVNHRFLVIENQQPCERDTIAHQLFRCIDSIAADPMTNYTFLDSLEWWNEQQANRRRKEDELRDAKDKLAKLQCEHARKDLEKLRSKHRCLEDECSHLSSKRSIIREIMEMLVEMHQIGSETDQFTADNAALKEELKRVEEEENVLHEQEDTLEALRGKVMQRFDGKVQNCTSACTGVISNRDEGIATLEHAADEIDKVMLRATATKISGFSAGIAGGVLFTVGTGLLLGGITAVAGIPLMVVGGLVGGAGSVTAIGGTIGQLVERSLIIKKAKNWLKVNKEKCQDLIIAHEGLPNEHEHIVEVFPCFNARLPGGTNVQVGEIVNTWKDIDKHSAQDVAVLIEKATSSGLGVAQGVLEGVDAGAEIAALGANAAVKAAGGVAIGLSGLVMIIDLGFLIKSSYDLHKVRTGNRTKLSKTLMELAEAVRDENNLLRQANICAAGTGSVDETNGSVRPISNLSMGNEEQLPNSLEPEFTNEVRCHTTGDAHSSSAQDEGCDHDGDDVPMVSQTAEAGEDPSTLTVQQSTESVNAFQVDIQADRDTESDTDSFYPEILSRIDSELAPQTDTSDTGKRYCIVS